MLNLRAVSSSSLLSHSKHIFCLKHSPSFNFKPFSIKMSSSIVEHIVLFKVKDGVETSKVNDMLTGLNGLVSLQQVLYLTAGPVLRERSSFNFTHLLHSRYNSKEDLAVYTDSPSHMNVVKNFVLPISEDIMAVDWVADDLKGPVIAPAGSAFRVTFLKLKENVGEEGKKEVIEAIKGIENDLGPNTQLTVGENFSPARAKGFSIASIAIFPGTTELEAVISNREMAELHKEKVREHLESVVVVDYAIPSLQPASL